ncbi:MAG: GAF domain-containing protein, partial [Acidobacteria bacterium]|nr:GAF domain-containing protein [Acidobacteriota bacterium]
MKPPKHKEEPGSAPPRSPVRFRERAELLDFLLEVAGAMSETLDLDRIMADVAEIVKEVIPYELFAILLYSEKLHGLRIRHGIGHRAEMIRNLVIHLGEGITGAAAATRQPILVADVRKDERYLNALDAVRSELAVPMMVRGKLVGVIDIQSTRLNAFSEYDRSLLRLIASRVAVSIDNARLYRRVERHNRTLRTLQKLSQEYSSILVLDDLLARIAQGVRSLIEYDAFSILLVDAERSLLRNRFSVRYDQRVELDNIPLGKGITGAAAESRQVIRVGDTAADPRYIASHPDIRSEVAVPLVLQDRVIGVMDFESGRMNYFTEDHVRTLSLLAPQVASSVENARLYEQLAQREQRMNRDLKAARNLQTVLLPRSVGPILGLELAIGFRPAREVSGDLYDFFEYGDQSAMLAFGDSSGKGVAAALYAALVSGLLRTIAPRRRGPAMLMQALNDALIERRADAQYATLLLLLWNARTRLLTMANAGGTMPLICRGRRVLSPRAEGVPLGLLDAREYDEVSFQTEPGDVIALFSDGVQDQPNPAGDSYERGRLGRLVQGICDEPPQTITYYCERVALADIAAGAGTPCYVYSGGSILERYRAYDSALAEVPHKVCYAVKANSNLGLLRLLADAGAGFDIVSGGELYRVLAAGAKAADCVFSGVGKTAAEIEYALEAG